MTVELGLIHPPVGMNVFVIKRRVASYRSRAGRYTRQNTDGRRRFSAYSPKRFTEVEAKYAFETDDGAVIYIENIGIRFGPREALEKIKRGEPVDQKLIYFRTVPRFETGSEKYRWLMESLFVGVGEWYPDRVQIDVHKVL